MKHNNSKGQFVAQLDTGSHVISGFDYTYPFDGTGRLGRIINTRNMFVNPADVVKGKSIAALQFEPLAVPTLNNMYVKQEHFYVPFNVVWENFDDFISGGEDMDYNGKVPSASLSSMWLGFKHCLTDGFTKDFPFDFLVSWNNDWSLTVDEQDFDYLCNWTMPTWLVSYLDSNQLLDLFDHVQPLMRQIGVYLKDMYQYGDNVMNGGVKLFVKATAVTDVRSSNLSVVWNEDQPNKYLREIYKSVVTYADSLNNGSGVQYIIPNEIGMVVLTYMYEIIKPFFGLGSYLDQLGYNKLRFVDFLYLMVCGMHSFLEQSMSEGMNIAIYEKFSTLISEKPQSILPLRAQYCVWWNNYRDQLLETAAMRPRKTDSATNLELLVLLCPRLRCWHKDTFTTALDSAGTVNGVVPTSNQGTHESLTMKWREINGEAASEAIKNDKSVYELRFSASEVFQIPTGYISGMHTADEEKTNSTTSYFSLDMLEAAKRAQKWLRKSVFYGNRIQDFLATRFGVKFLDARLKLPELLATSSQLVRLTDVINPTTIETDKSSTIAGDRSAIAHAFDEDGGYFDRYCEEHGVIISNLTVMPDCSYMNGFARELSQLDQFDFPFEEFAVLGLDAVYDVEMSQKPVKVPVSSGSLAVTDAPLVFGYQGRYYNYKAHHGEVHGELLDTQDKYLFSRKFNIYDPDSMPKLNYIFVHCHPYLGMFVVDNEYSDYFRYNIMHSYSADRLLPVHSMYL